MVAWDPYARVFEYCPGVEDALGDDDRSWALEILYMKRHEAEKVPVGGSVDIFQSAGRLDASMLSRDIDFAIRALGGELF
jgi:hypothetical protein